MNPALLLLLALNAVCAAALAGCAWTEQEPDEVTDKVLRGMSGQGTVTNDGPSGLSSWEHRN